MPSLRDPSFALSDDAVLPPARQRLAIVAVSLGSVLTVIDGTIVTVALPTIARDLHVAGSSAILIVTVYQLVLVMALLPCSGLGDRIGIKRFYQYGQVMFVIATTLCFFANSLPFLLIVRAMQAIGAAAMLSVASAMIRSIYPMKHLGRGLGINSVVASTSGALAPTVGGLILGVAPWPWVFATAVPFGILSLWLGWKALPDVPPIGGRYDLGGAMLNMATFGLLITGAETAVHGDSPVVSAAVVACGIACAIWFVRHELAEPRPILPVDLLARPVMALSASGTFLAFVGSMLLSLSLPFRLQHNFSFTPSEVGAVLSFSPLTMMVFMPIAGMLSDRMHPGIQGGLGMAINAIGVLLMAFPPAHPAVFDLAWRMVPCGIGFALFITSNSRFIIRAAPRNRTTAAGGLVTTTRMIGQTTGATLVAALLSIGLGTTNIPLLVAVGVLVLAGTFAAVRLALPVVLDNPPPREAFPDLEV